MHQIHKRHTIRWNISCCFVNLLLFSCSSSWHIISFGAYSSKSADHPTYIMHYKQYQKNKYPFVCRLHPAVEIFMFFHRNSENTQGKTQCIEWLDSFNTMSSKQKLHQAFKSRPPKEGIFNAKNMGYSQKMSSIDLTKLLCTYLQINSCSLSF